MLFLICLDAPFVQGSPNQYLKGMYRNSMFLLPATPDEIRGIINNLKHSSPGWDGITPKLLKEIVNERNK